MLRASQVLAHVAHLLRPGLEHYQERPAEDGGGRVWLSLKMRHGDERARGSRRIVVALPCKKKKNNRGIVTASPDSVRQIGPETVRILLALEAGNRKSVERRANDTRARGARTVISARTVC